MLLRVLLMIALLPFLKTEEVGDSCIINNTTSTDFPFVYMVCSNRILLDTNHSEYDISGWQCYSAGAIQIETDSLAEDTCKNLSPCTNYNLTVTVVGHWDTEVTFSKQISTLYSEPLTEITGLTPHEFSITVGWKTTNINCIEQFGVKTQGAEFSMQEPVYKTNATVYEYEFKNVVPCKNYNVSVITQIKDPKSSFATPEEPTTTKYADPGPIENANLTVPNSHTAILTWAKPGRAPDCIDYYEVKWKAFHCEVGSTKDEPESCVQSKNISASDSLNIHFDNLEACEQYRVDVNVNGASINNWNKNFKTSIEDLKAVENFTVVKLNKSFELKWAPPNLQQFCIKTYNISTVGPDMSKTITTSDTSYLVVDLKPCGSYNISIAALDYEGKEGANITQNHKVLFEKPDRVEDVHVTPQTKSLIVTWRPPKIQELCVKEYRITAWENPSITVFGTTTNQTTVYIDKLSSCTSYSVQIIPTAPEGDGNNLVEHGTTSPELLGPPIVSEYESTHESLRINATIASDDNRCDIYYVRYNCETEQDARIKQKTTTITVTEYKKMFIETVQPLSPSITYNCKVSIYNIKGWSENGTANITTRLYYPEKPTNLSAISKTSKTVKVKWSPPRYPNGEIRFYEIHVQTIAPKYKIPSSCPPFKNPNIPPATNKKTEMEIENLGPHIEYSIQVAAVNDFGTGDFTASVPVITKPDVSSIPSKSYEPVLKGPEVGKPYSANVTISWDLPCVANGDIDKFEGVFEEYRDSTDHRIFSWSLPVTEEMIQQQDTFYYTESRLRPEYNYTVTIGVVIKDVETKSEECTNTFISPAGIPTDVPPAYADVDPVGANNPTTSAMIRFSKSLLHSELGSIKYVALLLSEKHCQDDPLLRTDVIQSESDWPSILSWVEAHKGGCIKQYQTTPIRWFPKNVRSGTPTELVTYPVGEEECPNIDVEDNATAYSYCNGPLKSDTSYYVVIRLFTSSGYTDLPLTTFQTDSVVKWYLVVLLVLSCLLIAFLSGFIYMWANKKILKQNDSSDGVVEQTGDVTANNFFQHYQELSKPEKIQREFRELTALTNDLSLENTASKTNPTKNRYTNIFPYDKNRVILDLDEEGSDYINASFINGYKHKKEFIATQGPKPETFVDFWRMVLQHNVYIIVMVTRLKEGDVTKCHQYFPPVHQEMQFGNDISVSCIRETSFDTYVKREFKVEHTGEAIRKPVLHFFFKRWPDHECPSDTSDLINFVRAIRTEKIPSHSPITVHCSAGVGRTGTFIALDIIMRRLKIENKINIYETVKKLRFQRMRMVQTVQQYTFLYTCAHDLVKSKRPIKGFKRKSKIFSIETAEPRQSFSPTDIESAM